MKSAEEILKECCPATIPINSVLKYQIFDAMKVYASQALDEAAEKAQVKVEGGNGYSYIDKQSILNIKSQLK